MRSDREWLENLKTAIDAHDWSERDNAYVDRAIAMAQVLATLELAKEVRRVRLQIEELVVPLEWSASHERR
jgi:hypothetical protein